MNSPHQFLNLVKEYTSLIDDREKLTAYEILRRCAFLLPSIYAEAMKLLDVEPETDGSDKEPEIGSPFKSLRVLFGKYDAYQMFFNPITDESSCVGTLSDDLSDVYLDLKRGLIAYEEGRPKDAIWEWKFGLQSHFGQHISGAMGAIHYLVHVEMEEDYENPSGSILP